MSLKVAVSNAGQLKNGKTGAEYWTFQEMMCGTGGGEITDPGNAWHQWFDGTAVTLDHSNECLIGHKWATGINGSNEAISKLSFSLSLGDRRECRSSTTSAH